MAKKTNNQEAYNKIRNNQKKALDKLIEQEENYVAFLKKRLASENYKAAVSKEEYEKEEKKYDKAKLRLKFLKEG